jgi:glycosyltransferase involved in cell wall biosynthesis
MSLGLTLVVHTYNEAERLPGCLDSVGRLADEIVVCDMHSTDETVAIALAHEARVVYYANMGYADPARQFAIDQATQAWVLVLDADERLSPPLRDEIEALLRQEPACEGYQIPRRNWMFGKYVEYGSWKFEAPLRLFRRGAAQWPAAVHHEASVQGRVGRLAQPMLHQAHTSVARFIEKLNRYTDLEAQDMFQAGQRVGLASACLGTARAFLGQYVRLQGFRDGGHGLILGLLMAFYYFSARAKLWTLWYLFEHPAKLP